MDSVTRGIVIVVAAWIVGLVIYIIYCEVRYRKICREIKQEAEVFPRSRDDLPDADRDYLDFIDRSWDE